MVQETSQKVQEIINDLHQGGHIDTMTKKWLSQTPCLPGIPLFYTQVSQTNSNWRTYKLGLRRRPTERISSFLDHILQPIAKAQKSYLKGSQRYHTIYYNFIEERKVPENAILVSMDITSLYTNIP